jgi:hypothetical protein
VCAQGGTVCQACESDKACGTQKCGTAKDKCNKTVACGVTCSASQKCDVDVGCLDCPKEDDVCGAKECGVSKPNICGNPIACTCATNETCEGTQCKACPTAAQVCVGDTCGVVKVPAGCAAINCGVANCTTTEICQNNLCTACPTKEQVCGAAPSCQEQNPPPAACKGKVDYDCVENCITNEACEAGTCQQCKPACDASWCGPNKLLCNGTRTNCPPCGGG